MESFFCEVVFVAVEWEEEERFFADTSPVLDWLPFNSFSCNCRLCVAALMCVYVVCALCIFFIYASHTPFSSLRLSYDSPVLYSLLYFFFSSSPAALLFLLLHWNPCSEFLFRNLPVLFLSFLPLFLLTSWAFFASHVLHALLIGWNSSNWGWVDGNMSAHKWDRWEERGVLHIPWNISSQLHFCVGTWSAGRESMGKQSKEWGKNCSSPPVAVCVGLTKGKEVRIEPEPSGPCLLLLREKKWAHFSCLIPLCFLRSWCMWFSSFWFSVTVSSSPLTHFSLIKRNRLILRKLFRMMFEDHLTLTQSVWHDFQSIVIHQSQWKSRFFFYSYLMMELSNHEVEFRLVFFVSTASGVGLNCYSCLSSHAAHHVIRSGSYVRNLQW